MRLQAFLPAIFLMMGEKAQVLANDDFAVLTHQIAAYVKDTSNECLAVMNKVMEIAGGVVQKHAKTQSLDKENAIRAYREIRAHMVDPKLPDTAAMESGWARILSYLREGAEDRAGGAQN